MDLGILIIGLGVLASLGCAGLALAGGGGGGGGGGRAGRVHRRWGAGVPASVAPASLRRVEASRTGALDRWVKRVLPRQSALKTQLARTGRDIPLGSYALACLASAVAAFLAIHFAFGLSLALAVAGAAVAGVGLPHRVVGALAARRENRFNAVFPDAIDLMVRGLRSGLPVTECMTAVGREMPGPVGEEFRRVTDAVRFGQPLEAALWETAGRLSIQEFKFFVISLSVQRETGGNLAETLANLSEILRKRRQLGLKVRAMSSEARASAMILGALPFVMFGLIWLLNTGYASMLLTDPRGKMMLGGALGIMGVGILVMRKMIRFEV